MAKAAAKKLDIGERHEEVEVVSGYKEPETLPLSRIRVDGGTQMRASLNDGVITDYASIMVEAGGWGEFPEVVVFYDGHVHWLGDGFHRVEAARLAFGEVEVPADIRSGDRRDAILYAVGANAKHGLRRSNADKRRAVETLLMDPKWGLWSDNEIARRCGVSSRMVGTARGELKDKHEIYDAPVRAGGDGRTINVSRIGRAPAQEPELVVQTPRPLPSPSEVAYEPVAMFSDVPDAPTVVVQQPQQPQRPAVAPRVPEAPKEPLTLTLDHIIVTKLHEVASLQTLRMHMTANEIDALRRELHRVLVGSLSQ